MQSFLLRGPPSCLPSFLSRTSSSPSPGTPTFYFWHASPSACRRIPSACLSSATSTVACSNGSHHEDDSTMPRSIYFQNVHLRRLCKNGSLQEAWSLFSSMDKDLFSWNTMMSEYARLERSNEALHLFSQMQNEGSVNSESLADYSKHGQGNTAWELYLHMQQLGILQSKVTCVIMLSVCASEAYLDRGKRLHAWVMAATLEDDVVVGTALINMYSKCYSLKVTHTIFDGMVHRDLIVWNAMIAGRALNEKYTDVFHYFDQMHQEGVMPREVTCTSILDACASPKAFDKGKAIHARLLAMDLGTSFVARAALVHMYGKCGSPNMAANLFNECRGSGDVVLWNTMISTYAKHGMYGKSMQLYDRMVNEGTVVADKVTFISILSLMTDEVDLHEGRRVHSQATCLGFDLDMSVGTVLVSMYSQCSSFPDALTIFNKMSCQDVVMFVNIITACTAEAALGEGERIHSCIKGSEMERNTVLGNALVNMYSKCGDLGEAERLFERMPDRNIVSWSVIISAYAQHGEGKRAFRLFGRMRELCIKPDNVTLSGLLVACSHAGDLKEAYDFFQFMIVEYPVLALDHVNCMIDLIGRSGSLDFAEHLVNRMPFQPNSLSWSMLVCPCHIHADVGRGNLTAEYALELDSDDSSIYVLLSNMYGGCVMASD